MNEYPKSACWQCESTMSSRQRQQLVCTWQFGFGWMMALHSVSVGMMTSYNGWLNWYAAAAAAVCVWSCRPPRTPHPARTHVCLVTTHIYADHQSFIIKIQLKIVSLYASICVYMCRVYRVAEADITIIERHCFFQFTCRSNKSTCDYIWKKLSTTKVCASHVVLGIIWSMHNSIYTANTKA